MEPRYISVVKKELLPTIPNSSASQQQRMIVSLGFHPKPNRAENHRAMLSSAAVPVLGSTAPYVHASLWFPSRTYRSDSSDPFMTAKTFCGHLLFTLKNINQKPTETYTPNTIEL